MIKVEIEGPDGSGKSTALKYLVQRSRELGFSIEETREVGNPHLPSCLKMREFVLDATNNLSGEAMELIFSAMRIESDRWLNGLKNSKYPPHVVFSDRGFFSHLAYGLHNTSDEFIEGLFEKFMVHQTQLPHVVIYFEVDGETALKRRTKRGETVDVIEAKGEAYQEKVRNSFNYYLDKYSETHGIRIFRVDAKQDLNGVKAQLDSILQKLNIK